MRIRAFYALLFLIFVLPLFGCENEEPDTGPTPLQITFSCTVTGIAVFSGEAPLDLAVGQTFSMDLSFLPGFSHVVYTADPDTNYAGYTLTDNSENYISSHFGSCTWEGEVHQILIHNDADTGDRIAFYVIRNMGNVQGSGTFDFRDSDPPFDMLSSLKIPQGPGEINIETEASGHGSLSCSGYRVNFSVDHISQ